MTIDIDQLSEEELIELNNRVVARLRMLRDMRAHMDMMSFRIGDRVSFQPSGNALLHGLVTRYNRKTVTVVTDQGAHWNVSPALLRKSQGAPSGSNIIMLADRKK
jgi:hypothetical protein